MDSEKNVDKQSVFLKTALNCGNRYLACGGPTTRIEESIKMAAENAGFRAEVFATPTGLFISLHCPVKDHTLTEFTRIKSGHMNLDELTFIEKILRDFTDNKITLSMLKRLLEKNKSGRIHYPFYIYFLAPFLIGFYSSFPRFESSIAAICSGLLTFIVFTFTDIFQSKLKLNSIFTVFGSCFSALLASFFLSEIFNLPPESFAIGVLIFLVPGLTLTTSISELCDQNLVSGTAKMMNGILILLAMGISYLLLLELNARFFSIELTGSVLPVKSITNHFWTLFISNTFLIAAFAIYLNVPLKDLFWSTLTGILGWLTLKSLHDPSFYVLASFTASFCVGLLSLIFSALFKNPSQIYSVPGILSLLPGLLALSTFEASSISMSPTMSIPFKVALTGGAVVFGLITARIPALFFRKKLFFES